MGYNPADEYVTPTGIGVYNNIFGENKDGGPGSSGGGFFGGDPFGTVRKIWDFQRLGYGGLPSSQGLQDIMGESQDRYNNWSNSWDKWNATDIKGPDGRTLLSPLTQTGLRVGQDYGARNADGSVRGPAGGDIFQGFTYLQNKLSENPYLDPTRATGGLRDLNASSPYAMPNPNDYVSGVRGATGGPDASDFYGQRGLGQNQNLASGTDFDRYGLRGIDQTNQLAEANLRQLSRGIDREAQLTIADQLPEVQQQMEAMGLGRSGAGQAAVLGSMRSVLNQANRDKQRVMADFTDREANRQAQAINLATQQGYGGEQSKYSALSQAMNLGSQIGAQGQGQYADIAGRAAMQGYGDLFNANQTNRQNEQALWSQMMGQEGQRYGQDSTNYLNALIGGGQYQLGSLDAERMGQSQALSDWMGLQAQRDQFRGNRVDEYLNLSERDRATQQERINQMIQAGYLPLNLMQTITTGVQGNAGSNGAQTAPWWQGAAGGVAQGVVQGVGSWFGDYMGKKF